MKKALIIILGIVCITATSVLGFELIENTDKLNFEKISQATYTPDNFIELLTEKEVYIDELNKSISKLIYCSEMYDLQPSDLEILYKLVEQDYNLEKILELYEFLIGTENQYDWDYTVKLYNKAKDMVISEDRFWKEDTYAALTENKHGIIKEKDIQKYIESGLTIEEIAISSKMSRNGQLNLQEILERKISGENWLDIANDNYNSQLTSVACDTPLIDIYNIIYDGKVLKKDVNELAENSTIATEIYQQKSLDISEIKTKYDITEEITDEIIDFAKSKLKNIPEEEIIDFLEKGATIRELEHWEIEAETKETPIEKYISEEVTLYE